MPSVQKLRSFALSTSALCLMAGLAQADIVHLDDVIVDGSICVGQDCVNGESFGFDTIRLKENNLRIKFQDTSATASFPSNDWQITANDSSNGGANKFSIDDIDGGRTPFTIEASAPSHSLFVDDGGRIGLGTSTPVVEVHVKDGDTPTVRLEQDGTSGFTPQTFDMAANETNFFVRDATNGSTLPFRIRPGAPTSSIDIAGDGDVGINTGSPAAALHVRRTNGTAQILVEETNATNSSTMFRLTSNARPIFEFENSSVASSEGLWRASAANNGDFEINNVGVSGATPVEFDLTSAGALTIAGALTQNSDKNNKMAIVPVDHSDILEKVRALPVSHWTYKHDADAGIRHIGPMAQDFYALFGTGKGETGISTLDTSGVALAAIQALSQQNAELNARIAVLESQIAD